jgi:putative restriction endonuclease
VPGASPRSAAHIFPYCGEETNIVQNGLLLRAHIPNLFDLGLLQINAETLAIRLADELRTTAYRRLDGRKLRLPRKPREHPNREALAERIRMLS